MKNILAIFLTGISLLSVLAGCVSPGSVASNQKGNIPEKSPVTIQVDNTTTDILAMTPTSIQPDKVELIYFHTKVACHCMAAVRENIKYAVDTYFKSEISNGKVKLTTIVSDDPANAELVKKYDAMLFTLFIREIRGDSERIYPVNDIWEMTGDENRDKLITFIKTTINDILEGKSS